MVTVQANRGRAAEELVRLANADYRRRGVAVVEKVPTEWLPIRGQRDGRWQIVSAKVERPAVCDFLGHVGGHPIAFDVKEWSRIWRLHELQEHQAAFLRDWHQGGGIAFVLLVEHRTLLAHVLFWEHWEEAVARHAQGVGRATLTAEQIAALPECPSRPGNPVDYLAALDAYRGVGQWS